MGFFRVLVDGVVDERLPVVESAAVPAASTFQESYLVAMFTPDSAQHIEIPHGLGPGLPGSGRNARQHLVHRRPPGSGRWMRSAWCCPAPPRGQRHAAVGRVDIHPEVREALSSSSAVVAVSAPLYWPAFLPSITSRACRSHGVRAHAVARPETSRRCGQAAGIGGMEPSALAAASAPTPVRLVPSLPASLAETAAWAWPAGQGEGGASNVCVGFIISFSDSVRLTQ